MKHLLFERMGDKYPFRLEARYERILIKIEQLWDTPQIEDYFSDLIIDKRGGRQGFSKEIMEDIWQLKNFRESETLRKGERKEDAIRALQNRGINVSKEQFLHAILAGDKELVDLFVRANFNVHSEDAEGTPAILLAMKKGYTVVAHILLNAGADVNAIDRMGMSPLLLACGKTSQGYKELAELLINKGANINIQDKLGYTPLLLSLSGGDVGIAMLLIERGADITAKTRDGENALSLAEKADYPHIVRLLRKSMYQQFIRELNQNKVG
ncbi:MAG TPA: ankyrin repeat domain-containing protein [Methylophilus sp.]